MAEIWTVQHACVTVYVLESEQQQDPTRHKENLARLLTQRYVINLPEEILSFWFYCLENWGLVAIVLAYRRKTITLDLNGVNAKNYLDTIIYDKKIKKKQ